MNAAPGLRREEFAPIVPPGLLTGVPAFLGHAAAGPVAEPVELVRPADFGPRFGAPVPAGYLAAAVDAFFRNGGERCVVVRTEDAAGPAAQRASVQRGLEALRAVETVDLVCAPDLMRGVVALADEAWRRSVTEAERTEARDAAVGMQQEVLEHCDRAGDRMALLDALPGAEPDEVLAQRHRLVGHNGALYYPWLLAEGTRGAMRVPPCGHVAGTVARGDARTGVHAAPANQRLEGVLDVEKQVDDAGQAGLNAQGVNCIRAFPGRGIRVWGARTLSREAAWKYVGARRVFLTLGRWISLNVTAAAFEPGTPLLWARVGREVSTYLKEMFRRGALRGRSAEEAFYVRCDASTNPPEVRRAGVVVTEIGLAPVVPNEFVVVRFTHGQGGVDFAGPGPAA
jgi:phage tail sheath protein FI